MRRVVPQDEAGVHHFDPEAKQQNRPTPPKKFKSFFSGEGDGLYLLG